MASEDSEYETWRRERRERDPSLPDVSFEVYQMMLEGQAIGKRRAMALLSHDEDEVYEWDRHLSREERVRFARLLMGEEPPAAAVAEEPTAQTEPRSRSGSDGVAGIAGPVLGCRDLSVVSNRQAGRWRARRTVRSTLTLRGRGSAGTRCAARMVLSTRPTTRTTDRTRRRQ